MSLRDLFTPIFEDLAALRSEWEQHKEDDLRRIEEEKESERQYKLDHATEERDSIH